MKTAVRAAIAYLAVVPFTGVLAACSPAPSASPPAALSTMKADPTTIGGLTSRELALARDLARAELKIQKATITSATVTVDNRVIDSSNTGYVCKTSRILHIKLIGTFPRIVLNPIAGNPGATVHALNIAADAMNRRACLIGVQTGNVHPARGAATLLLR